MFFKNAEGKVIHVEGAVILGDDGNFYQGGRYFKDNKFRITGYPVDPDKAFNIIKGER